MSKKKELSAKARITIAIKNAKPLHWWIYVCACVILFAAIVLMGVFGGRAKNIDVPQALTRDSVQLRITVAGDINISDSVRKMGTKIGYAEIFQNIEDYWAKSDYVIASVSGPVLSYDKSHYTATKGAGEECIYLRPAALRGILNAGINVLNFANDDTYNYGKAGMASTLRELANYAVDYIGIAATNTEPLYRVFDYEFTSESGDIEQRAVAVMGINAVVMDNSTVRATRVGIVNSTMESLFLEVFEASQTADILIVYLHDGIINSFEVDEEQQKLSRQLIDAGADIVVASHSGTVLPVERYSDGLILYGLGNLVTDAESTLFQDSAVMDLVIENSGEVCIYLTPVHMTDGMPAIAQSGLYNWRINQVLTEHLGIDDYTITKDGILCIALGELPEEAVLRQEDELEQEMPVVE